MKINSANIWFFFLFSFVMHFIGATDGVEHGWGNWFFNPCKCSWSLARNVDGHVRCHDTIRAPLQSRDEPERLFLDCNKVSLRMSWCGTRYQLQSETVVLEFHHFCSVFDSSRGRKKIDDVDVNATLPAFCFAVFADVEWREKFSPQAGMSEKVFHFNFATSINA